MQKLKVHSVLLILAVFYLNTGAQTPNSHMNMAEEEAAQQIQKAICVVIPTQGNKVSGTVTFTKVEGGVRVVADISGLTKGKHGIHIHEFGDCSSPDGNAAGGHYNPVTKSHGAPVDANRHAGDMGNIEADENGKGRLDYIDKAMTLEGEASIIGRAMIIHADEDDLKTQPTGNAGARQACGVIGVAK
jgi:Cu-Zn family superoxide dismutase